MQHINFFHFFYYDTLKHDETVIRPTILYTFIDLMYAILASFTILTHDQRDVDKERRINEQQQLLFCQSRRPKGAEQLQ
jgi:hypothetical protein